MKFRWWVPTPPRPDWGWRIEIHPAVADGFQLRMYNITPDGEEALAAGHRQQVPMITDVTVLVTDWRVCRSPRRQVGCHQAL